MPSASTPRALFGRAGPCDRCDGPHHANDCPHFKRSRDDHKDATDAYGKNGLVSAHAASAPTGRGAVSRSHSHNPPTTQAPAAPAPIPFAAAPFTAAPAPAAPAGHAGQGRGIGCPAAGRLQRPGPNNPTALVQVGGRPAAAVQAAPAPVVDMTAGAPGQGMLTAAPFPAATAAPSLHVVTTLSSADSPTALAGGFTAAPSMAAAAAMCVAATPERARVVTVGISGASASGKSSLAEGLKKALGSMCVIEVQSGDSYWLKEKIKKQLGGNYEHPHGLDWAKQIKDLVDKKKRSREKAGSGQTVYVIVEGYLNFWHEGLTAMFDKLIFLDSSSDNQDAYCDLLATRRCQRDRKGKLDDYKKRYRSKVWSGYLKNKPFQRANMTRALDEGRAVITLNAMAPRDEIARQANEFVLSPNASHNQSSGFHFSVAEDENLVRAPRASFGAAAPTTDDTAVTGSASSSASSSRDGNGSNGDRVWLERQKERLRAINQQGRLGSNEQPAANRSR